MKIFIALCLVAVSLAYDDALSQVLKSPRATLQLYNDFKSQESLQYLNAEDRMRFRIFRKNAEFVAAANSIFEDTADYGLNFFSSMTEGEKSQYLGLNVTGHLPNADLHTVAAGFQAPTEKLWVKEGAVTSVKNQGSCGSCWTFGAVGGLETRYQQVAGKLRNFAEQEWLDCVYPTRDGCQGGWPSDCYDYSKKNGGRMASTAHYNYVARDGSCKSGSSTDDMIAAKISGYTSVGRSEAANIQALASGSLSVAFEVTNYFQQYKGGIIRDTTCTGRPNHAVTSVGYTASYVLVKNSWGGTWGDSGFVKFARNYGNCGLFDYSSYPTLSNTGSTDSTPSDAATTYIPSDDDTPNPGPDPTCVDKAINCKSSFCKYSNIAEDYCRKTCGLCDEDDNSGDCPSGTIRCSDGICRHEHMC